MPISMHELLYPLAQGYDSVALRVRRGNGRHRSEIQSAGGPRAAEGLRPAAADRRHRADSRRARRREEDVEVARATTSASPKPPEVMFRKVMQISDELMFRYYELLTDVSLAEIAQMRERCRGDCIPWTRRCDLGRLIVTDFHSAADARRGAGRVHPRGAAERSSRGHSRRCRCRTACAWMAASGWTSCWPKIGLADSVSRCRAQAQSRGGASERADRSPISCLLPGGVPELIIQVGKQWRRVREP